MSQNYTTNHFDNFRTGWNSTERRLIPEKFDPTGLKLIEDTRSEDKFSGSGGATPCISSNHMDANTGIAWVVTGFRSKV